MKLEFKKRTIELNLYGKEVKVSFPTSAQLDEYLKGVEAGQKGELNKREYDLMIDMLGELGLDKEDANKMEIAHLNELASVLLDVKKN